MATKKRSKSTSAKKTGKKTAKPRSKDHARLAKMMAGIDFCMMTTRGEDGSFHTRPMSNNGEVELDADSWFFTWRKSCKVEELADDDRVSLSLVGGTKKAPVWIAIAGTAEIVDDLATKKKLWKKELDRWFEDGPEDPDVVLLKVRAQRASYWSYEEQGEVTF